MTAPTFVGVKNCSGGKFTIQHGGDIIRFEKDEVKVMTSDQAAFSSKKVFWKGESGGPSTSYLAFKTIPLEEALKVAKLPENQSIKDARDRQAEIDKRVADEREKWEKDFMKKLQDQGLLVGAGGKKS